MRTAAATLAESTGGVLAGIAGALGDHGGEWLPGSVYCSTIASTTSPARRTVAGPAATIACSRLEK